MYKIITTLLVIAAVIFIFGGAGTIEMSTDLITFAKGVFIAFSGIGFGYVALFINQVKSPK